MSKPEIVGITVSVDISDKNYGTGIDSFLSLQGRYPDPIQLSDVLEDGLDMYLAAWESLLASRYATSAPKGTEGKAMTPTEFKQQFEDAKMKLSKVKSFLARMKELPANAT